MPKRPVLQLREGGYVATNTDARRRRWLGPVVARSRCIRTSTCSATTPARDVDGVNADFDQWRVGVGYNKSFSPKADFVANVAYEKYDFGGGLDFDGYSAEAGVRGALTPMLEGYALARLRGRRLTSTATPTAASARRSKFNPTWGVTADVKVADGDTQWFVGPRLQLVNASMAWSRSGGTLSLRMPYAAVIQAGFARGVFWSAKHPRERPA